MERRPGEFPERSQDKLPPVGLLEGVDLVTEGILTLSSAADRLQR